MICDTMVNGSIVLYYHNLLCVIHVIDSDEFPRMFYSAELPTACPK